MALPSADTVVTYPDGDVRSEGTVVHLERRAGEPTVVLLDRTAFHPVDARWPDQPADRGTMRSATGEWAVVDALTGVVHEDGLLLGDDVTVRTGTPGYLFVVAHLVDGDGPELGEAVVVEVEDERRRALSAGHTGCHLASFALDAVLDEAWSKPAPVDALGNHAFDSLAIERSEIEEDGSVDRYRIGRSLRKKGFDPAVLADPEALVTRVDDVLARWVASGAAVELLRDDPGLSARRAWRCALPEGIAEVPCGGTHLPSLAAIASVHVRLEVEPVDGGMRLLMRTRVQRTA